MNRTGLIVALSIAAVVGIVFAIWPQLDITIGALFYNPATHSFAAWYSDRVEQARDAASLLITLCVVPAFLALVGKIAFPQRRMLIPGRAALFLIVTLALGPGLLTNVVLKGHSARMRPVDVVALGGKERFTPWWDPRGDCPDNCSFVAGEASGGFWTLAPAALTPPQWRAFAYAGALVFGTALGLLRMAAGGHFFTDVVFAGVLMYVLIWILHGLIYRWRATRLTDTAIERPLEQAGTAIREGLAALSRRVSDRRKAGS
jgi:lipid A 4'-phosphatase